MLYWLSSTSDEIVDAFPKGFCPFFDDVYGQQSGAERIKIWPQDEPADHRKDDGEGVEHNVVHSIL